MYAKLSLKRRALQNVKNNFMKPLINDFDIFKQRFELQKKINPISSFP